LERIGRPEANINAFIQMILEFKHGSSASQIVQFDAHTHTHTHFMAEEEESW
jgi:hypothetical protein